MGDGWNYSIQVPLEKINDHQFCSGIVALYEQGFDELEVAQRTGHTPDSVGHYLRDYERVKVLMRHGWLTDEKPRVTNMRLSVVKAYADLAYQYHPELLSKRKSKG